MQTLADLVGPVPQILADLDAFIGAHPVVSSVSAAVVVAALVAGYRLTARTLRVAKRLPSWLGSRVPDRPAEDLLTVATAAIATGVSAQGMWRFFGDVLGFDGPLRILLFAFIELAVVTSAIRARRSMRERFSAGIDGVAVWALTGLTAVLSAMDARGPAEVLFRLTAPLVAAWLWERGMAVERRRVTGLGGIHWRLTPERVLVRLGLAEAKDRTADEVDTQRRFDRVSLAAKKVRVLREVGAKAKDITKAQTKLERAYAAAHAHTGLGRSRELQEKLAAEVASLYSAGELVNLPAVSAWTKPAEPSDFDRLAKETARLRDTVASNSEARAALEEMRKAREEMRAMESNVAMLAADVTRGVTHNRVTSGVTRPVTDPPVFVPTEWTSGAPAVTDPVTPIVTPPVITAPVNGDVTRDITDQTAYDLFWALRSGSSVTGAVTGPVTPPVSTKRVTRRLTFTSKQDARPKTEIMREYWDQARKEGRYPGPTELAKVARANPSLASRRRAEWVQELSWTERRRANIKPKKIAAVNGSPAAVNGSSR
ncbi:hypothetical protein [Streptosporangium sandarakinum]